MADYCVQCINMQRHQPKPPRQDWTSSQNQSQSPHAVTRFMFCSVVSWTLTVKLVFCCPSLLHLTSCSPAIHFIDLHSPCILLQSGSQGLLQPIPAVIQGTVRLTVWTGHHFSAGPHWKTTRQTTIHTNTPTDSPDFPIYLTCLFFSVGGRKPEMMQRSELIHVLNCCR